MGVERRLAVVASRRLRQLGYPLCAAYSRRATDRARLLVRRSGAQRFGARTSNTTGRATERTDGS
jgi:hypothetical protein